MAKKLSKFGGFSPFPGFNYKALKMFIVVYITVSWQNKVPTHKLVNLKIKLCDHDHFVAICKLKKNVFCQICS